MSFYIVKTPSFIKAIFNDLVWSFSNSNKELYITFDDGPTPEITTYILNLLEKYNAKATFFCVGDNVKKYPTTFKNIIDKGHAIGNHTFNHLNGWKTNADYYIENIEKAQEEIEQYLPNSPKLYRPPYGKIGFSQIKKLKEKGFKIVMWDVLSGDFDTSISAEKVLKNVMNNTKNGSILVFHDHQKAFDKLQYSLPIILEHYNKLGYSFKKIK